jgi:hypothetical protein
MPLDNPAATTRVGTEQKSQLAVEATIREIGKVAL